MNVKWIRAGKMYILVQIQLGRRSFMGKRLFQVNIHKLLSLQATDRDSFGFNRLDMVIKYFAIEQYFKKNCFGYDLYSKNLRFELARFASRLKQRHKTRRTRIRRIQARMNKHSLFSFKKMVGSFQNKNNYDPIIIDQYYCLNDGSHRVSCALYFGKQTMLARIVYPKIIGTSNLTIETYKNSGFFSGSEIAMITKKTKEIIPPIDEREVLATQLKRYFNSQNQDFGKKVFYQSYEPLGIKGMRPSATRFKKYQLSKYLSKSDIVLDIGCNCGFFSHYIAQFVHSVEGFDNNKSLIKMANSLKSILP